MLLQTFTANTQNAYDIEVDSDGNIYTLNPADALVRKYDATS